MKKTLFLFSFLFLTSVAFLTFSCKEEEAPCIGVVCQNSGICLDGRCECPDGYLGSSCENFDPLQVQELLDSGISPKQLYDSGITLNDLYGKLYEGGLIFYLSASDGTGLVAAPTDGPSAKWGCGETLINGADGEAIGTGMTNTLDIINGCSASGIAAKICNDLFVNDKDDWFLPSKDELTRLRGNLYANGHSDFQWIYYWSSTESSDGGAWSLQKTQGGIWSSITKNSTVGIRAIRKF